MFLVSGPDLVVEACRNGVIGAFPTPNLRTPEALEQWLIEITERLAAARLAEPGRLIAPWAVNLVVHSTNVRLPADLELVVKYRAPIVITALGSPSRVVNEIHAYGGLVFADVNSIALAKKAAATGVDGLILVASGAGGHTGALSGFSFVPAVRKFWDGLIVLGGGICDGAGIRAAEVLGADYAYMGTRFIPTRESLADDAYAQMLIDSGVEDILATNAFTGATANMLRPSIVAAGLDPDNLIPKKTLEFNGHNTKVKAWTGILSAGHGIVTIDRVHSVAELIAELDAEYQGACRR
jgi:nitronate monooxygenase